VLPNISPSRKSNFLEFAESYGSSSNPKDHLQGHQIQASNLLHPIDHPRVNQIPYRVWYTL